MTSQWRGALWAAAAVASAFSAPGAGAEPPSMIDQGHAIAIARCGVCHAVDGAAPSPHRSAPPFRSFADTYPSAMLQTAMQTGIITGHDEMPGFDLPTHEMAALLAFIDSLAPLRRRYLSGPRAP